MKKLLFALLTVLFLSTPAFARSAGPFTMLSAVTTATASSDYDVSDYSKKTFYITAASVSTGGTVLIQTSSDLTNWSTIGTVSVTANGTTEVAITGLFHKYIRSNLSARTDGTYTVTMYVAQ